MRKRETALKRALRPLAPIHERAYPVVVLPALVLVDLLPGGLGSDSSTFGAALDAVFGDNFGTDFRGRAGLVSGSE